MLGTLRAAASYPAALDGADIACATTHALEPVVGREWLGPGVRITSVGSNRVGRQAALAPFPAGSNDLREPIRKGLITASHVDAELGELIAGTRSSRSTPEQITLYKSVGVAVQDAAATALVLTAARTQGLGTHIGL